MLNKILDYFFDYLDNGKVLVDSFVEGFEEAFNKPEELQREVEFLKEKIDNLEKEVKYLRKVTGPNLFSN